MPELVFSGQRLLFSAPDCPITIGASNVCRVQLQGSAHVDEIHLEIFFRDGLFYVKNLSEKRVTSTNKTTIAKDEIKLLGDTAFFLFGAAGEKESRMVAYSNEENKVKVVNVQSNALRTEQEMLVSKFYNEINLTNVSNYLVGFIASNFCVNSAIVYKKEPPSSWSCKAHWRLSKEDLYKPSYRLFKHVVSTAHPIKFDAEEEDGTRSIIDNNVRRAFVFPLSASGALFGLLYLDAKDDVLSDKDFYKITYLLSSGVSALIYQQFKDKDKQESVDPKVSFIDVQKDLPFRLGLRVDKIKNSIVCARNEENYTRIVFINPGQENWMACLQKGFISGLMRGAMDMSDAMRYGNILREYFKDVSFADVYFEFYQKSYYYYVETSQDFHVAIQSGSKIKAHNNKKNNEGLTSVFEKNDTMMLSPLQDFSEKLEITIK